MNVYIGNDEFTQTVGSVGTLDLEIEFIDATTKSQLVKSIQNENFTHLIMNLYCPENQLGLVFNAISCLDSSVMHISLSTEGIEHWTVMERLTDYWYPNHQWTFSGSGSLYSLLTNKYDNIKPGNLF